ncbi:hypothetical protein DFH07DRAFT_970161 [Mycena maculata]|uniref:Transmembrane protein n=1 Tax=Mycena maculata TaxID=230809 RepID=A0AAD7HST0_9AGAR|nr:hypothetical protein DFH07DRAFT_970161 [Mycena maculata]
MSLFTHVNISRRTAHTNIMFAVASAMFFVATWHFVVTFYRTVQALSNLATPGSLAAFLEDSKTWHARMRGILVVTQCLLGDFAVIYRCWILWDRDVRIVTFPLILLVASTGSMACQQLSSNGYEDIAGASWDWIVVFYAIGLAQNIIATTLMAFRLWRVDRQSMAYQIRQSQFRSTMLLLVESAALYFALQIVVLAGFLTHSNIQIILLGSIPPVVGTTFTFITIRVALRSKGYGEGTTETQTTGTLKMRELGITIDISETIDASGGFGVGCESVDSSV